MKQKIFSIAVLFFIIASYISLYANEHDKAMEYFEILFDSAKQEYAQKNYVASIEILEEVKTLAKANSWNDYYWNVLNQTGLCYDMLSDYDKAMDYYLEAYEIVLKTSNQLGKLVLLANIARSYASAEDYNRAIENIQKAITIAKQLNDTFRMGTLYANLGWIINLTKDFRLAEKYIDTSLFLLEHTTAREEIFFAKKSKVESLYLQKAYPAAEKLAIDILKEYGDQIAEFHLAVSFLLLTSRIYQQLDMQERVIYYTAKALDYNPSIRQRIDIYNYLSSSYWKNNAFHLAWTYRDSVIILKDSLHKVNTRDNLENYRIRFELLNSEKELAENKAKQKAERTLFLFLFVFVVVLAIILLWVFHIQSIRNKQRKQIVELELEKERNQKLIIEQHSKEKETLSLLEQEKLNNDKLRLEQQLKEQETLALLEQERLSNEKLILSQQLKEQELEQEKLNNEIEAKNKQLTARILSHSNKHEWINEMLQLLLEIPEQSRDSLLESIIRKLKIQSKDSLEWDTFLNHFEEMNPVLLMSLQKNHPNLTANDIQLLACIYLDLDTKKIAYLLNVSVETCRKKKERLAGKIGIKASKLRDYFKSIEKTFISYD